MLLLAADEDCGDGVAEMEIDAYALRLRPGALFVVGDPKQSIYRFRRADIDVYNRVREAIQRSGGEVVSLTTSFQRQAVSVRSGTTRCSRGFCRPKRLRTRQRSSRSMPTRTGSRSGLRRRENAVSGRSPCRKTWRGGGCAWAPTRRSSRGTSVRRWTRRPPTGPLPRADSEEEAPSRYAAALQATRVPMEVTGAGAFGGSPVVRALVGLLRALGDPA